MKKSWFFLIVAIYGAGLNVYALAATPKKSHTNKDPETAKIELEVAAASAVIATNGAIAANASAVAATASAVIAISQAQAATASLVAATSTAKAVVASQVAATSAALAGTASAVATPKDINDWTGDHLQINANLEGFTKKCDATNPLVKCESKNYVAPAYTQFDVAKDNSDGTLQLTIRNNFEPVNCTDCEGKSCTLKGKSLHVSPWKGHGIYGYLSPNLWGSGYDTKDLPSTESFVDPHDTYTIKKTEIESISYSKYGWTYGALVVPYKYQRGYKALNFSNSAQLYAGFKRDDNGTAEGPFISAGLSTADISTGTGTTTPKQGFSYGLGWVFEIKKGSGFQIVAMAGQDVFGANSGYQYEGDVWYSVTLGMSLDSQAGK